MKKLARAALASATLLALAACGSADDASEEAVADNVEIPADDAMAPIVEAPVADTAINEPVIVRETTENPAAVNESEQVRAETAADNAADVAARAQAAAAEAATATAEDRMD
ncbi:hypothetical protein [Pseudopontixanthobacter vadosimaris]|uniref:hypothetical protein n=1 Tax=Pseudopontixanthobacter vadosimaris TaxID=2726450 RepID=UPI0014765F8D|nr:hypothetical protein [Pseudopontixanthobacter vadosimaris]